MRSAKQIHILSNVYKFVVMRYFDALTKLITFVLCYSVNLFEFIKETLNAYLYETVPL